MLDSVLIIDNVAMDFSVNYTGRHCQSGDIGYFCYETLVRHGT